MTGSAGRTDIPEEKIKLIQEGLGSPDDFRRVPSELAPGQLSALLIQREIKRSKKFSYRLRNNLQRIKRMWFSGSSFTEISRTFGLLPMQVAYALRPELRYGRKDFQELLRMGVSGWGAEGKKPHESRDERVCRELGEAARHDWLHSPWALEYMKKKGMLGEQAAEAFLRIHGLEKFMTEKQQQKSGKTPDFLLDQVEDFPGTEFRMKWFESKATFGSMDEVREDNRTQLSFYTSIFGPGAIVYWLGLSKEAREFLANANGERTILVLSGEDLCADVPELVERLLSEGLSTP